MEPSVRTLRLQTIVQPVIQAWQDPELTEALSTFAGFCRLVGMEGMPEYLSLHNYASAPDWSSAQLDEEGKQRQSDIQTRILVSLPRRQSRVSVLTFSAASSSQRHQEPLGGNYGENQGWLTRILGRFRDMGLDHAGYSSESPAARKVGYQIRTT